jgi:tetratricopeptide (TPR) repeat protein
LLVSISLSYAQNDKFEQADQLNEKARQLYQQGKYTEAITIAQKVLVIKEKSLGPDHLDVAHVLDNLAELYRSLGDYTKAKPLFSPLTYLLWRNVTVF